MGRSIATRVVNTISYHHAPSRAPPVSLRCDSQSRVARRRLAGRKMFRARGRRSLARILEVGDEIRAVLGLLQTREDHLRAGDVLLGVEEVIVEGLLAPLHTLVLVGRGVREALGGAGDATEEAAEVGALRGGARGYGKAGVRARRRFESSSGLGIDVSRGTNPDGTAPPASSPPRREGHG